MGFQLSRAFGAFEDVKEFLISQIQRFRGIHERLQSRGVQAVFAIRVRIVFQHVTLKHLEELRVVLVIAFRY